MSASTSPNGPASTPADVHSEEDLFALFDRAFRPGPGRIGIESERVGLFADGAPLRYHHHPGVQELFHELSVRYGWKAEGESPGGPPISLVRGRSSITLEPGSQFELSGAPHETVHAVVAELEEHRAEMSSLQSAPGLTLLGLGFQPRATQGDLDWVPKGRYSVMREYLPTRGSYGLDMMRRTATVQANFDCFSERDAMRKLRVSLAASPVVTALFANSAVVEGKKLPLKSHRARVWLDMDPDRTGLLPFAWAPDAALGDYVRWALGVPLFILKREGRVVPATSHTFGRFLAEGLQGYRATVADWEMHLGTLFPEVRLKRTLEVRGADSVPSRYAAGLPALWAGILYDPTALDAAERLLVPLGYEAWQGVRPELAVRGLETRIAGTTVGALARALLGIASGGLLRRALTDDAGEDERVYLNPLEELAEDDRSVGDALLQGWSPDAPDALGDLCKRARF